jgi:ABC-type sulfate transport system substrate-binding protein
MQVGFPSNIDTVTLTSDPVHMVFPVTKTTNAASYTVWAAFRLTPEQLEYNRQHRQ